MLITPLIRQVKKYCPVFEGRVAGGLDWDPTLVSAKLPLPAAYIIMTGDQADDSLAENIIKQPLRDLFDVFVILKTGDERGQDRADQVHSIRQSLFKALLGFIPSPEYSMIQYDGGSLTDINRGYIIYQFSFYADCSIGRDNVDDDAETWQEVELDGLPGFNDAHLNIDAIDPMADKNLNYPGPDGRIEFQLDIKPNGEITDE